MRCCNGERTEKCDCRKLFHLYISSNHQMWVNYVMVPENLEKLFRGKTIDQRSQILQEIENSIDRLKMEVRELVIDVENQERIVENTPKCYMTYDPHSCACPNCKWLSRCSTLTRLEK